MFLFIFLLIDEQMQKLLKKRTRDKAAHQFL